MSISKTKKERAAEYYQAHKTEIAENHRIYRQAHKTEVAEWCKAYYQAHKTDVLAQHKKYNQAHQVERAEYGKKHHQNHKAENTEWYKKHSLQIKTDALAHYGKDGKPACVKCGYSENIDGLALDHINGNGREHRRSINKTSIYLWTIQNNYPKDFQTLCGTCHLIKTVNRKKTS